MVAIKIEYPLSFSALYNKIPSAIVVVIVTIKADQIPKLFKIATVKNKGNAISPPPKIAFLGAFSFLCLEFFGIGGVGNPLCLFSLSSLILL